MSISDPLIKAVVQEMPFIFLSLESDKRKSKNRSLRRRGKSRNVR